MLMTNSKNIVVLLIIFFLTSCGNISSEAEKKFNELKAKTDALDSLITKEVDKVVQLDSLINKESEKVKQLDTLLNKSTSRLDSIAKKGSKFLEKITQ